jgi:hypothetical protein
VHRVRVAEAAVGQQRVASAAHLVSRFFESLVPRRVSSEERDWVEQTLLPAELALWTRLPRADQRESVGVAYRTQAELAGTEYAGDPRWSAAALLHDVGKLDARFGPVRRAIATLLAITLGPRVVESWVDKSGFRRRCALYVFHDQLGADRVKLAGGRKEAALWADAHHRPAIWDTTGLPPVVMAALAKADGEKVSEPSDRAR